MTAVEVRAELLDAMQLDLIGPTCGLGDPQETLPQSPSRWYLTGFLVPTDASDEQRTDPTSDDELDQAAAPAGIDDDDAPEKPAARKSYLSSSMGLSVLLPGGTTDLTAVVRYGKYLRVEPEEGEVSKGSTGPQHWRRMPHEKSLPLPIDGKAPAGGVVPVPESRGVEVVWSVRGVPDVGIDGGLPPGTRSLSVFLVNRRKAAPDEARDEGFIFQAELELQSEQPFIARPNLRSLESDDWDERVADLQYRDVCEYSVGHSVSADADAEGGRCRTVRTCWLRTSAAGCST